MRLSENNVTASTYVNAKLVRICPVVISKVQPVGLFRCKFSYFMISHFRENLLSKNENKHPAMCFIQNYVR